MRQASMTPIWKRKFVHTTESKHELAVAPNVLARQFNPTAPNLAQGCPQPSKAAFPYFSGTNKKGLQQSLQAFDI
jgi:hypothetical protein